MRVFSSSSKDNNDTLWNIYTKYLMQQSIKESIVRCYKVVDWQF
jgi:hypothetical protein